MDNPQHGSLHFKRVRTEETIYSIRINRGYRALGRRKSDDMVWFWIGSHPDYERVLGRR